MEITEEGLAFSKPIAFPSERLFDLDNQVGLSVQSFRFIHDLGAAGDVIGVVASTGAACIAFNQNGVSVLNQGLGPHRQEGHSVFVGFDLLRYANLHFTPLVTDPR